MAGDKDISQDRETQIFAIDWMKMFEVGIVKLAGNNKELSGDTQNRREINVVPEEAQNVLQACESAIIFLGKYSKEKIQEVLNHQKLIKGAHTNKISNSTYDTNNQQQVNNQFNNAKGRGIPFGANLSCNQPYYGAAKIQYLQRYSSYINPQFYPLRQVAVALPQKRLYQITNHEWPQARHKFENNASTIVPVPTSKKNEQQWQSTLNQ
ncbi:MAG: hypothetical protein EZS28_011075 [Streblomastix strix]|uniref:Uncharacterized protein n=1 Tax=Streblomastix strix TaxID=222440 RepID=A0A5J4WEK4_9EUKA|nr:MAG: hypothetical protein EZS28_011075 [Streblomastix strix]